MMKTTSTNLALLALVCCFALFTCYCNSLPLSTNKRWIVDDATGKRVKLVCTHWVSHLKPMVAEGLDKYPLNDIAAQLPKRGFNCVRLSYATYMFTRYANQSVSETISNLDIPSVIPAISKHNPWVLNMTHLEAYEAVVDALAAHNVMVIIDNHVSKPDWCCNNADGNGFFGDRHFQPEEWLRGLASVATHFKGKPYVVGMDLRNELRGARQNAQDWYKYVSQGVTTIHNINPDLLVIVSGLNFDSDFTFLKKKALDVNLCNKLVYEVHLYSFSGPAVERWNVQPLNRVCAATIESLNENSAFVMRGDKAAPLWLSEFGYDMRGVNSADNNYLPCLAAYAASLDLDWSLWAFGGSYYYREGQAGADETYALLDYDWTNLRDHQFSDKFQLLQRKIQDPSSNLATAHIMFHPLTGKCVHVNKDNELEVGNCKNQSLWSYEGKGTPIRLMGSPLCLKADSEGRAPVLSQDCLSQQSAWKSLSLSGLHLSTSDKMGEPLCLEMDSKIVTKKCICTQDDDSACLDNPQSQWFKLVPTNVGL